MAHPSKLQPVDKVWMDGQLVPFDSARVHILTHTLHYGLGAFEGIRCYRRADGRSAVFRLAEHIDRLIDSCRICTIEVPFTKDQIIEACLSALRANKMTEAYLRPVVFLGSGALGLGSLDNPVHVVVAVYQWGAYLGEEGLRRGIRAKISSFTKGGSNAVMAKGKICGQYVNSVLAKREAMKAGYAEAILLDERGWVAEASGENVFLIKRGRIQTPPRSSPILDGITRDTVIELARAQGIVVEEQPFTRDELYTADEVFFTGTAAELTPVCEVDDRRIGAGQCGPITKQMQDLFFATVKGRPGEERPIRPDWLTFV